MSQLTLDSDFERVSLPEARSRNFTKQKAFFTKKELSDEAKRWLVLHEETNWKEISFKQEYQTVSKKQKITKWIEWHLPGTSEKKDYCGTWNYKGCFNCNSHPDGKAFVKGRRRTCFRSVCETCWLEKWLARESSRATRRINNYYNFWKKFNRRYYGIPIIGRNRHTKPIHVIVSPPWKDKFLRYDLLKEKCRKLLQRAGVSGGLMIYHSMALDKDLNKWVIRPHFHVVGFGWVINTNKISDEEGWVIKNKGIRKSVHSTLYYQLSHAGVSEQVHSLTWFGTLGYRTKYAQYLKLEKEETIDYCDFCGFLMVDCEFIATDRPPPDFEFDGCVDVRDWRPLETVDEAVDKRDRVKNKREERLHVQYFNEDCLKAKLKVDDMVKDFNRRMDLRAKAYKEKIGLSRKIIIMFLLAIWLNSLHN